MWIFKGWLELGKLGSINLFLIELINKSRYGLKQEENLTDYNRWYQ